MTLASLTMNAMEEPPKSPASGPVRELLRSSDFLRLWLVGASANAMRWLEMLASGLFAWELTGSALAVTAVVAARQLPLLLLGAFAGAISEAINRKLILMTALVVAAVTSTLLATLATTSAVIRISLRLIASEIAPAKAPSRSSGS